MEVARGDASLLNSCSIYLQVTIFVFLFFKVMDPQDIAQRKRKREDAGYLQKSSKKRSRKEKNESKEKKRRESIVDSAQNGVKLPTTVADESNITKAKEVPVNGLAKAQGREQAGKKKNKKHRKHRNKINPAEDETSESLGNSYTSSKLEAVNGTAKAENQVPATHSTSDTPKGNKRKNKDKNKKSSGGHRTEPSIKNEVPSQTTEASVKNTSVAPETIFSNNKVVQEAPASQTSKSGKARKQKPASKAAGKKPDWSVSAPIGGWFLPQDPIFSVDEK